MSQHGESAAHGTAVLAGRGVHEARFDNVHRGRHHGCAEARAEGSGEVARQIIWAGNRKPAEWHPSAAFSAAKVSLIGASPVIRPYLRISSLIRS